MDLAELAASDPVAARAEADHILATSSDPVLRSGAERAQAIAARMLHEVDRSVAAAERAVLEASRAAQRGLLARARATLAASLAYAGRSDEAWGTLDEAVAGARGYDLAMVLTQRAGLLARFGRFDEALVEFARALPLARRASPRLLADLLADRALLFAYAGQFARATRDAERALELFTELGSAAGVADMTQNLAFITGRNGDIVASLRLFDEAERQYMALGYPIDRLLPDRAGVLIAAGLFQEAYQLAADASVSLKERGDEIECSEALLLAAQAALAQGNPREAIDKAGNAERLLRSHDRLGWSAVARLLVAEAELAAEGQAMDVGELERLGAELEATGLQSETRRARLVAVRAAVRQQRYDDAQRLLRQAGTGQAAIDVRMLRWTADAELWAARNERTAALRAVRRGFAILDAHRAAIGSTELRARVAAHASDLGSIAVRIELDRGRRAPLLRWVERTRANALRFAPTRSPDDRALARELGALRQVLADLAGSGPDPQSRQPLLHRQAALERSIRGRARHRPPRGEVAGFSSLRALQSALGAAAFVELFESDGALHAIAIDARTCRLVGPIEAEAVRHEADFLRAALRRILVPQSERRLADASSSLFADTAARLDASLIAPLQLPPGELILSPPAWMHALPWAALPSLADRPFAVVPSAALWLARKRRVARPVRRALFAAGPDLPEAAREVRDIAPGRPDTVRLGPDGSTTSVVLAELEVADLAHIACHCHPVSDNPYFSRLVLADGPLFVYDVERLRRAPDVVILSACRSAVSTSSAGDELVGLSATLLTLGTATLIGSVVAVPDARATRRLMMKLHEGLLAGSRPAVALAAARRAMPAAGAAFVVYGVG